MHELLRGASWESMSLADYYQDFEQNFWSMGRLGFWKLERQQVFREPGYASWEAFNRGDWDGSLAMLREGRSEMEEYHHRAGELGFVASRVRVVEEPITPYLQWELHALMIRDECGGPVRIVTGEQAARYERTALLPEVYTLGGKVMYEAIYDDTGVLGSARRYRDPDLIDRCRRLIHELYEKGRPIAEYFAEKVAPMPPPRQPQPYP